MSTNSTPNKTRKPAATCANCGGPMPPAKPYGRLPIYCTGACRKAAYDARRARKPAAFEVKIVEHQTTIEHDLTECVDRVVGSPAACRKVLYELARMAENHQLRDPKWDSTLTAAHRLMDSIYVPHRVQQHHR